VIILGVKENLESMKTLDDAWNAGPNSSLWETFKKRHREDVKVYWPANRFPPLDAGNHDVEATDSFKTFDNKLVNNPTRSFSAMEITMYRCRLDW